ncbi:MAG: VWA domain-containing protein [Acidobacteria bacterium]|nr:VWA domain-containing protein [Acidobacteriota bacterium]
MQRRIFSGIGLLVLCTLTIAAQQPSPGSSPDTPPPTFRLEVNYVEVDAVVTDSQGNLVTDLTLDDFEVRENGRPQKVTAFSTVNLPIERPERPLFANAPIEPDVESNTAAEGRIYTIVLDDLHTRFTNTPRVQRALREFIEQRFGTNDLAAVVYTSGRTNAGQEFTNNTRLLLAAIDRFSGRNLRSEALEINDALNNRPPGEFATGSTGSGARNPSDLSGIPADPLEFERAQNARNTLTLVQKLAEFMEGIRGRRKSILLVSEGISYDVHDVFANSSAGIILQQTRDTVAAATRGNVAIYALDPRGLTAFDEAIEVGGTPADITPSQFSVTGSLQGSLRLSQQSLQVLADETGGFAAVNRNDLSEAFARIVRENSVYYVLGYYPSNDQRDGRFRTLDVRVKRPGLQVRARRGYVAPRGRAPAAKPAVTSANGESMSPAATTALNSPIPLSGIPLTMFAAAYKGTPPDAAVALSLELRLDGLNFAEKNGTFNNRLEVVFSSVDQAGTIRPGSRHVVTLELKPETLAIARQRGFRVLSEITLPPGRYQLRAAVADQGGARSGSVLYDLEVPDFRRTGLSMSGVSLTSASGAATPTVRPKDPLKDFLPGPASTVREFQRNDVLALFAEFYENIQGAPTHMFDMSTTLRAEDGRVVYENREERSSADLQGASGGFGYGHQIPLQNIAPGTYVLRVEGRSRAEKADQQPLGRDVIVRVR